MILLINPQNSTKNTITNIEKSLSNPKSKYFQPHKNNLFLTQKKFLHNCYSWNTPPNLHIVKKTFNTITGMLLLTGHATNATFEDKVVNLLVNGIFENKIANPLIKSTCNSLIN